MHYNIYRWLYAIISSMKKIIAGILAHVDAGKTTLSEMMLYRSGALRSLGRVDHGDSHMDTDEIEKARGITIYSSQSGFDYKDLHVSFIDTPGHVDFSSEMERALSVLDYAILVISGSEGVQSHTITLFKLLADYDIPAFIFVNKMDISYKTRQELMDNISSRLSPEAVCFNEYQTASDTFFENVATCDEKLLDQFLDQGYIDQDLIADAIGSRKLFPVIFGSALKDEGVDLLLDILATYVREPAYGDNFSARVFKISRDKNKCRETFMKITGGTLSPRDMILPYGAYPSDAEKVNEIRFYDSARYTALAQASAGDIVAVTGLDNSYPGQGYGDTPDARLPGLEPVLSYKAILTRDQNPAVIYSYFKELMDEDPLLGAEYSEQLKEISVKLMGRIQLEVLRQTLADRFGVTVDFGTGNIIYRESISRTSRGHGHYEPLKHFADVVLDIEPLEAGSGLVVTTSCTPDVLEKNYQHQVLNFLSRRQHPGILTGFPVTDMHIDLCFGKSHKKHTEGGDFRRATDIALRDALLRNEPVLLEPYYDITLELPQSCIGRAMTDIEAMHGSLNTPEIGTDSCTLHGRVPVACIIDYALEVAAYTGGTGRLSLKPAGYYPCHNADEVIEKIGYNYITDYRHPYLSTYVHQEYPDTLPDRVLRDLGLDTSDPSADIVIDSSGERQQINIATSVGSSRASDAPTKAAAKKATSGYQGYGGLEPELEQIFTREFGEIKRYRSGDYKETLEASREENIKNAREEYLAAHPVKAEKAINSKSAARKKYVLVDGYNVIFASPELSALARENLDGARGALLDKLCNYQGYEGCELIAVFDAYRVKGNPGEYQDYYNIHVVYTREAQTADAYIEHATHEIRNRNNSEVTVVSSDGIVQLIVMGEGAARMSSREFLELL